MKQETLEEAGEKLYPNRESFLYRFQNIERKAFIDGAKWQQERSYSEEKVYNLLEQIGKSEFLQKLRATKSDAEARRLIFETFKKK